MRKHPGFLKPSAVQGGAHSRLITPRMRDCILTMRAQLDPAHTTAALSLVRKCSSISVTTAIAVAERKTGWDLFDVVRMSHTYIWCARAAAQPFFKWLEDHPNGGTDWPTIPGVKPGEGEGK